MLLKNADNKGKRVTLLEELRRSNLLDARQKGWIDDELDRLVKGMQGEQESAYFLDQYFKDSPNHVVLHDLRFVHDDDVAQIDHLIINRVLGFYLVETKNYGGNVTISAHGEFTAEYGRIRMGVESPIEQSRRHERVLRKMLERLEITNRLGADFDFHHVVMYHPRAIITRPSASEFDTTDVIKADQFPTWHKRFVDKEVGVGTVLKAFANMRSMDTIREWAEKLMRQHRPQNLLELPEFMQPKAPPPVQVRPVEAAAPQKKKLECLQCGSKITYPEGKFCWNNEARFKGGQYCREHQALFK